MKRLLVLVLAFLALPAASFADTPPVVKFRRLELKSVSVTIAGQKDPVVLKYGDLIRQVLLSPGPGGVNADGLEKVLSTWAPIKKAIANGDTSLLLNDDDYKVLLDKVNAFQWSPVPDAAETVGDFIAYVRGLQPEDFSAVPKPK